MRARRFGTKAEPAETPVIVSEDTVCADVREWSDTYYRLAIAFIIVAGVETVLLIGIFARRTMKVHASQVVGLTRRFDLGPKEVSFPPEHASPERRGAAVVNAGADL